MSDHVEYSQLEEFENVDSNGGSKKSSFKSLEKMRAPSKLIEKFKRQAASFCNRKYKFVSPVPSYFVGTSAFNSSRLHVPHFHIL